jgi:F-type H+-transporting ATPase subunit epsilon
MYTLTLVTPDKKLVTDEPVAEVIVPAYLGELNILPGHAPLMTTLTTGVLKYRLAGQDRFTCAAISWGYCQVFPGGINILAETAETAEEINLERVREARRHAEEEVARLDIDVATRAKFYAKLRRAEVRESVAKSGV